ncbi:aminotransferase class IV [Amycolatopsis sp. H20-H5]|uniref:aminotransferase class IV n=1 Tax=Amycolatopsis sp. H20-H5 TaxID=3046309 RepID=UPI002DBD2EF7|nr:aminotransferase class IV [Amycolatopsis sp. H20-H5]MEC3979034.1 aminotransferase class IV [Amycolatopsis sp. H20-H5]
MDVIDSWLVTDGRVVSLEAHIDRFSTACASTFSVPQERTTTFLRAALRRIPTVGRWFPRLELAIVDDEPNFHLWLRPAPLRTSTIRLRVHHGPDQRRHPSVKGPDLCWLAGVRSAAQRQGADEAVILSEDGRLIEGTTTSLLWWRDDTLYAPDSDRLDLLPSVTRMTLLRLAADSRIRVAYACPRPSDLAGLETWAVNALHGVRPVLEWVGSTTAAGPAPRAHSWQTRLDALASASASIACS